MANACDVCGNEASTTNPVLRLAEVGDQGSNVAICQNCLELRELHSWDRSRREGRKLRGHLERPNAARKRYSYLEDPSTIHLVRLRHDWLAAHNA